MQGRNSIFTLTVLALSLGLNACTTDSGDLVGVFKDPSLKVQEDTLSFKKDFSFSTSESTFEQAKYDENVMSVYFQVNKDNKSVNDLTETDFIVKENSVDIPKFSLGADTEKIDQIADIVFVVDITGSMSAFIESAKLRLKEFIKTSREKGYHTRMCISTFGDYTVKKCDRFFDNNPRDESTESQVKELLSELASLRAHKGAAIDPGGTDIPENPMRALIDAGVAPWAADSQRFVILVTDADFLYSPDYQGAIGAQAPDMKEVTDSIKASGMKVFAVTPNLPGFNSGFQNLPSIVESSTGQFFEFKRVMAGKVSIDDILNQILYSINTTYKLTYVVDQVPGLDSSLPIEKRNVEVALSNPGLGIVKQISALSSMPTGHPEYQKTWKVADQNIQPDSVKAYIDEEEVGLAEYKVKGREVTFSFVPEAGSKLRFVYVYSDLSKNFRLEPITLPDGADTDRIEVYLNGKRASARDIRFDRDMENNISVSLNPSVLGKSDPYSIHKNKGLEFKVLTAFNKPTITTKEEPAK